MAGYVVQCLWHVCAGKLHCVLALVLNSFAAVAVINQHVKPPESLLRNDLPANRQRGRLTIMLIMFVYWFLDPTPPLRKCRLLKLSLI